MISVLNKNFQNVVWIPVKIWEISSSKVCVILILSGILMVALFKKSYLIGTLYAINQCQATKCAPWRTQNFGYIFWVVNPHNSKISNVQRGHNYFGWHWLRCPNWRLCPARWMQQEHWSVMTSCTPAQTADRLSWQRRRRDDSHSTHGCPALIPTPTSVPPLRPRTTNIQRVNTGWWDAALISRAVSDYVISLRID